MVTAAHLEYGWCPIYGFHLSRWRSEALKVKTSATTDCDTCEIDVNTPPSQPASHQLRVSLDVWRCFCGARRKRLSHGFFQNRVPSTLDLVVRLCHQTDGSVACNLKVSAVSCSFVSCQWATL